MDFSPDSSLLAFNFALFFPVALTIFAVPSTYAYSGVANHHVKITTDIIDSEGLDSVDKVELLEENLEKVHERVVARASFYKWLIGSIWALYLLYFNVEIRGVFALGSDEISQSLSTVLTSFIGMLIFTMFALLLTVGYKRASELLIKSIGFGCVDIKYRLTNQPMA